MHWACGKQNDRVPVPQSLELMPQQISVPQSLVKLHIVGVPPMQTPFWHVSPPLHVLPVQHASPVFPQTGIGGV